MAGGGDDSERKLDQTPTWAVAGICAAIVLVSLILEYILHKIGHWLKKKNKKEMIEALEKVKAELMILGFISLIFTFSQSYFAKICIPVKLADTMHPCSAAEEAAAAAAASPDAHRRRLLASAPSGDKCGEGKTQLISSNAVHQLHILIFYLAVFHVLYSAATMMLGKMKIRRWKAWETETSSLDHEFSNPSRFRLTHETSFVRTHATFWTRIRLFFYVGCFFRHIFQSVQKSDFVTLRNGFIATHLSARAAFNFQKYIMRSLEDDFKVVVGVSYVLWGSFVVFLLLNVHGWNTLLWTSPLPLIIILAVGTKLQAILTSMAVEITERHAVVQGIPRVQCSDDYFWFSSPRFLLHLLHFSLFQNAFQITYFLWIWYEFGLHSCFHENLPRIIAKICLGVITLFLCSYITLPLYALVTQMGSQMKKSVFDEQTSKALKKWQLGVKNKQGGDTNRDVGKPSSTITLGGTSNSTLHSSMRSMHHLKTTDHSPYMEDDDSPSPQQTSSITVRVEHENVEAEMTQNPSRTQKEGVQPFR